MDWSGASADEIDQGFDHFGGLQAAAESQLCDLIAAADSSQVWMRDGARSLTEWVSVKLRIRSWRARKLVALARRLVDLPMLSARFACGDLSFDQVEAISQMATPDTEEDLIDQALGLSTTDLHRAMRRSSPPVELDEISVWERRRLVRQWNLDESELRLWGNLPAAEGQILDRAIDVRVDQMPANPESGTFDSEETRAADALVEIAATNATQDVSPPQMTVFADLDALTTQSAGVTELESGALVPNETARRMSCDSVVETVVLRDDVVVGVGRNRRTIPGWLRRLVVQRAGGHCQFPGCGARRWLQVHHKQHWADGGSTDLDNLVLICGFHHRFVHEQGWHVTGPADSPVFRRRDWTVYPPAPDPLDTRLAVVVGAKPSI